MKAQAHIHFDGKSLPWGFWQNTRNHRVYFDWLGSQIGVTKYHDWYNIKTDTIKEFPGAISALSKLGKNSLPQALMNVYPEYDWELDKFQHTKRMVRGYYKDKSTILQILNTIAPKLGVSRLEDWYDIPANELRDFGGSGVLQKYNDSMIQLLSSVYPDYPWKPWLFVGGVRNRYWDSMENQRAYLDWLGNELRITNFDAWKTVTWRDVMIRGGTTLLKKYGSFLNLFSAVYPQHDWRSTFGSHNTMLFKQKTQMTLLKVIHELFPEEKVFVNYRHPELKFISGRNMELDIFIPSKNLALEYQGEQHYFPTSLEKNVVALQQRDEEKRRATEENGITLLLIPYWWDRDKMSLALTLSKKRPDLQFPFLEPHAKLNFKFKPIPDKPPKMVGHEVNVQPLFAQVYNPKIDPRGWWMSEKYDGVRAYWDGKTFLSKNKLPLVVSADIVSRMPPYPLDGEIWFGHGTIAESMKIVRKAKSVDWSKFRFMIFDVPLHPGTFEDRYQFLLENVAPDHPFMKVVPMIQCGSRKELQKYLQEILFQGGEGVMLRQPQSQYQSGRSATLLKVKPYKDTEAVVVSASPEMKHWECKLPNGLTFPVVNRSQLQHKVRVGTLVTFRHSGFFLNGRPRTPYILNTRDDLSLLRFLVDNHHYWASKRKEPGHCHTCKKELKGIRICVEATSQLDSAAPLSVLKTIEFCPSAACIHPGDSELKMAPFKQNVVVPSMEEADASSFTDEEVTMEEVKAIQPEWKWIQTGTFALEVERK